MTDQGAPHADFKYLGEIVLRWREALGRSQREVAEAGGPSDTTQSSIESGEWQSQKPAQTLRKIDKGLAWAEGTAKRVLLDRYDPFEDTEFVVNGETGRFEPAYTGALVPDYDRIAPRLNGLDRQVDQLAEENVDLRQRVERLEGLVQHLVADGASERPGSASEVREAPRVGMVFADSTVLANWCIEDADGDVETALRRLADNQQLRAQVDDDIWLAAMTQLAQKLPPKSRQASLALAARDTGRKGKAQKAREKQDEVGQESQDRGGMDPA